VDRISPDDAVAIRSGGAAATLKGIQFNSFGAFSAAPIARTTICGGACTAPIG
jgi:hypothetical protein